MKKNQNNSGFCVWVPIGRGALNRATGQYRQSLVTGISSRRGRGICMNSGSETDDQQVTREQVMKTAKLARLEIKEEEIEKVTEEFQNILSLFNSMKDLDVEGVEPMAQPHSRENVIREDIAKRFDDIDGIMDQVPVTENDFVKVPKISSESD